MSVQQFQSLVALARATAARHNLSPDLVCAVVEQESGWNTWAIRFEPAFEQRYIHPALLSAPTTEELSLAVSWGLMQVMGQCAREHGFQDRYFTTLCRPEIGLDMGCRIFRHKWEQAKENLEVTLLHWNGGANPSYASEVIAKMKRYDDTA